MAAQVEQLCAVRISGYRKTFAEGAQYVCFVERAGAFECWLHDDSSLYKRGLLGTASPPIEGTWICRRYGPSATSSGMKASSVTVAPARPACCRDCEPRGKPKKIRCVVNRPSSWARSIDGRSTRR